MIKAFVPNVWAFSIAIGIDLIIGEYPNAIHPVVWMGKMVELFNVSSESKGVKFTQGIVLLICDGGIWFLAGIGTVMIPGIVGIILQSFLFKSTFSIRGLYSHIKKCKIDDDEKMRHEVSMIVSRDTSKLNKWHLVSAALESLSENTSDSITGPFFYFFLLGLPGALLYRVVNTIDAMVGYHTFQFEWFGKAPARIDDVMNFIPSRITAMFFAIFSPKKAFRSIFKYGPIKINGTYPMSAFSGVLGVKFEKIGVYEFDGREPCLSDVDRGLRLYTFSVSVILLFFFLLVVVR